MSEKILTITGLGFAPWSSRGITQTLEPIEQAKAIVRTINGAAKDRSVAQFRKYKSSISCSDANSPAFDMNWPGKSLTVMCISELSQIFPEDFDIETDELADIPLGRTAVTGSLRADTGYVFYRPQLTMLLTSWNISYDEWNAVTGWNAELEEV